MAELAVLNTVTIDQVTKYDADGNFMDVIAAPGTGDGQVSDPTSVAVAPNGDLYVVDKGNDRVTRFDALGNYLGRWGGPGSGNGQFNNAEGIAIDSLGNVYVADTLNKRIQKFTSSGGWLTAWPVVPAATVSPLEIAIDSADVVYVVGGNYVRRFDTDGALLSEWSSTGATGIGDRPVGSCLGDLAVVERDPPLRRCRGIARRCRRQWQLWTVS